VATLENEVTEEVTGETYGPLKALCERAAEEAMPGRVLQVRPGLLVGPFDPSDRFTYWPHRIAQGGEVLAPGRPEREVQFIDVRDLAEWILRMVEQGQTGVYNTVGPARPLTMLALLETCRTVAGSDAVFVWADEAFLSEQEVRPYTEAPLWIPGGHDTVNCERARHAVLSFRLLEETIQDVLAWDATRPTDTKRHAGLPPSRERELLALWHQGS
jgi:2'-hydroxyisoflavone reductase